jgi:hypothetical protein
MIAMGILCFIYLICSIRTNLIFFLIFFTLVPAFGLLAGAFLHAAKGNAAIASKCQEAAGAFTFVTCMCGWYILLAIMLASVDFPFDLPRKYYQYDCNQTDAYFSQLSTCRVSSRVPARSARSTTSSRLSVRKSCRATRRGEQVQACLRFHRCDKDNEARLSTMESPNIPCGPSRELGKNSYRSHVDTSRFQCWFQYK